VVAVLTTSVVSSPGVIVSTVAAAVYAINEIAIGCIDSIPTFRVHQAETALCSTFARQVTILSGHESPITHAGRLAEPKHS